MTDRPGRRLGGAALLMVLVAGMTGCGGGKPAVATDPWIRYEELSGVEGSSFADRITYVTRQRILAPGEPYWPYAMGALYTEADSLGRAETALQDALGLDGGYPAALSLLSRIYYAAGRHADGITLLETARSRHPDLPPEVLSGLALHYEAQGDPAAAEAMVENLPLPDADPVPVYLTLKSDHFRNAGAAAERAREVAPESAVAQNNYGITCLHRGDPEAARKAFRTAHAIDATLPGPLYNLALVEAFYFMNEEEGRVWFDRYWALSQDDPDQLREVFHPTGTSDPEPAAEAQTDAP